jgi:hypothetical protein
LLRVGNPAGRVFIAAGETSHHGAIRPNFCSPNAVIPNDALFWSDLAGSRSGPASGDTGGVMAAGGDAGSPSGQARVQQKRW